MSRAADRPLPISVVIAARDAAPTIETALRSVLAQDSPLWELIVVDDGSVDGTAEMVHRVAGEDDRARLIQQPATGVSVARNLGLAAARHEWVLFLDADDRVDPSMLSSLGSVAAVQRHLDVVRCGWAWETADGRTQLAGDVDLDSGWLDLFSVSTRRCPTCVHAAIFRRQTVTEIGGFDSRLTIAEDWDLWQRLGRLGAKHTLVPSTLAFYRLRANSATNRDFARVALDCDEVLARGRTSDGRVRNPLPEYVQGASGADAEFVADTTVLYTAALAIGAGADPRSALESVAARTAGDVDQIALTLFDTIPLGAGSLIADWPALWPALSEGIVAGVDAIARWHQAAPLRRSVMRGLEQRIATHTDVAPTSVLGATYVAEVDAFSPLLDIEVPLGVQRVVARVHGADTVLGSTTIPVFDQRVAAHELRAALIDDVGVAIVRHTVHTPRRLLSLVLRPTAWRAVLRCALDASMDLPSARRTQSRETVRRCAARVARELVSEARLVRIPVPPPAAASSPLCEPQLPSPSNTDAAAEWEDMFAIEDPWDYASAYEQGKYEHTLELLDGHRVERAMELACAEGHFTVQLAPRVGHLLATDLSSTALVRARQRCGALANVEFRQLDLRTGPLPAALDLVVCSEVLYYVTESELETIAERIADSLVVGGQLVMAHGRVVADEPSRTAFDWWVPFGATRIGEVFSHSRRLQLRAEIETDLYRVQRFQRVVDGDGETAPPTVSHRSLPDQLTPSVRRTAVWGGFVRSRDVANREEITDRPPILVYHRIAPDGPDELAPYRVGPDAFERQIEYLRSNGFYGISITTWLGALRNRRALAGRAVVLTFDDGYRDFRELAAPVLTDMGFPATVFVVADFVGKASTWDERFGEPAPLMSWQELREIQRMGIEIGSHTASHRPLAGLPPEETLAAERRARRTFERQLGHPVTTLAYPYGSYDVVAKRTMIRAGYSGAVTSDPGLASLWDDPMTIPRIEINGDDDLAAFASKVGTPGRRNVIRRAASNARRSWR